MSYEQSTPARLFCLRAAASRAARKAKRLTCRFYRFQNGMTHSIREAASYNLWIVCRRAESLRHAYYDAACDAQRAALAAMSK